MPQVDPSPKSQDLCLAADSQRLALNYSNEHATDESQDVCSSVASQSQTPSPMHEHVPDKPQIIYHTADINESQTPSPRREHVQDEPPTIYHTINNNESQTPSPSSEHATDESLDLYSSVISESQTSDCSGEHVTDGALNVYSNVVPVLYSSLTGEIVTPHPVDEHAGDETQQVAVLGFEADANDDSITQNSAEPTDSILQITTDEKTLLLIYGLRRQRDDSKAEVLRKSILLRRAIEENKTLSARIITLFSDNADQVAAEMQAELRRKTRRNEKLTRRLEAKQIQCKDVNEELDNAREIGLATLDAGEISDRVTKKLDATLEIVVELQAQLADERRQHQAGAEPVLCVTCNLPQDLNHAKLQTEASSNNLAQLQDIKRELAEARKTEAEHIQEIQYLRRCLEEAQDTMQESVGQPPSKKRSLNGASKATGNSSSTTSSARPRWEIDFPLPEQGDLERVGRRMAASTKYCKSLQSATTTEARDTLLGLHHAAAEKVAKCQQDLEKAQLEAAGIEMELQQDSNNLTLIDQHIYYIDKLVGLMS